MPQVARPRATGAGSRATSGSESSGTLTTATTVTRTYTLTCSGAGGSASTIDHRDREPGAGGSDGHPERDSEHRGFSWCEYPDLVDDKRDVLHGQR